MVKSLIINQIILVVNTHDRSRNGRKLYCVIGDRVSIECYASNVVRHSQNIVCGIKEYTYNNFIKLLAIA